MSDLVTWLRAQLDADEQAARDALHNRILLTVAKQAGKSGAHTFWSRHDPARVLRQVAALRAIVELHAEPHPCRVAVRDGPFVGPWERIDLPAVDSLDPQPIEPCLTLRLLATIYADRDGYRPEWSAD